MVIWIILIPALLVLLPLDAPLLNEVVLVNPFINICLNSDTQFYWQFRTNVNFWPLVLSPLDAALPRKAATREAVASFSPACICFRC